MDKYPFTPSSILKTILTVRNQKVMLDRDLAVLYGIKTKRLNEQVKRNSDRFPKDFMFQLTKKEKEEVVASCDHLKTLKFSSSSPFVFTEHGAVMLSSVLKTAQATQTSIFIVRAFIEYRRLSYSHTVLSKKILSLEKKYDEKFSVVFKALKSLIENPKPERTPIGFKKSKHQE